MLQKSYRNSNLEEMEFGNEDIIYIQSKSGLAKGTYNIKKEDYDDEYIGNFYIYQITVTRDIEDRFEPLYNLKYEDMIFYETKIIKNKTFDELANFIKKQKLIFNEEECIEFILAVAINWYDEKDIYNDIQFVVKEKKDFMKEKLPMIPI